MIINISRIEERIFSWSLLASLAIHLVTLAGLPSIRPAGKPLRHLEVFYQPAKKVSPEALKLQKAPAKTVEHKRIRDSYQQKKQSIPSSFVEDKRRISPEIKITSRERRVPLGLKNSKPVIALSIAGEKFTNSAYMSFEKSIGLGIKKRIERHLHSVDFTEGRIYLTFALLGDGSLKQIRIIEEKTQAAEFLRRIAVQGVQESAPFAMPTDWQYPEMTFSVTIVFQYQ